MVEKYTKVAVIFHWVMALMVIGLLAVGLIMVDMPKPDKYAFYGWHKAIGMIALLLVTLRFSWRQVHPPPPLPEGSTIVQRVASDAVHVLLYGLMFAIPLLGWLMSSAGGHPVTVLGIEIPPIVGKNKELGAWANEMHELAAYLLIGLISLHLLAALYHHFICKDGVLNRMMSWKD